jgi:hypothetical protein
VDIMYVRIIWEWKEICVICVVCMYVQCTFGSIVRMCASCSVYVCTLCIC